MDAFPYLRPNSISYDLGALNVSKSSTLSSGPICFRHSLAVNNHILKLRFKDRTQTEVSLIREHYYNAAGQHLSFTVPAIVWGSSSVVSSGSTYRYLEPPAENQRGVMHDIDVKLLILTGPELLFNLNGGGASLASEAAFSSYAFNGTAPFIINGDDATPTSITMNLNGGAARL